VKITITDLIYRDGREPGGLEPSLTYKAIKRAAAILGKQKTGNAKWYLYGYPVEFVSGISEERKHNQ